MKKIKLTKGKFALVDDEDFPFLNKWKWKAKKCKLKNRELFYAVRKQHTGKVNGKYTSIFISMHRLIMKVIDVNILIDHEDHDGLNNQKYNLRKCSKLENCRNKLPMGQSKYSGVTFYPKQNKWRGRIRVNGKENHLGMFSSEIEAAKAYDKSAIIHFGKFANLNFK